MRCRRTAALLLVPLALVGCSPTVGPQQGEPPAPTQAPSQAPTTQVPGQAPTTQAPTTGGDADAPGRAGPDPGPELGALALAPSDTAYLTLTDWSAIKARLDADDLTGESLPTDTIEFWRAVGSSTVMLTDGALRAENSRLRLRYGFTQDDVVWEVRWAGADAGDGPGGLALRLRDGADLADVQRAVTDGVHGVQDARLVEEQRLLVRGGREDGAAVDGSGPLAVLLDAAPAESRIAAPGCLTWPDALGVDADVDQQEAVVETAPVEDLLDPAAWGMSFTGRSATLTVVHREDADRESVRADAAVRLALAETWPTTEGVGWSDAFGLPPGLVGDGWVVEQRGDRLVTTIDYRVVNPGAAASVVLSGLVPGGVCAEVDWLAEPTGL